MIISTLKWIVEEDTMEFFFYFWLWMECATDKWYLLLVHWTGKLWCLRTENFIMHSNLSINTVYKYFCKVKVTKMPHIFFLHLLCDCSNVIRVFVLIWISVCVCVSQQFIKIYDFSIHRQNLDEMKKKNTSNPNDKSKWFETMKCFYRHKLSMDLCIWISQMPFGNYAHHKESSLAFLSWIYSM